MKRAGFLLIAVLGFVAPASQALAHAHLRSATPAMNGTVPASPSELDLAFSEGLALKFSGVTIMGPDLAAVSAGDATLEVGDDTKLIIPVPGPLKAGTYTVRWHALSTNGHKTSGSYTFTIQP